jgi:ribosome biogenesis protein BMS1
MSSACVGVQDVSAGLDEKLQGAGFRLFPHGKLLEDKDMQEEDDASSDGGEGSEDEDAGSAEGDEDEDEDESEGDMSQDEAPGRRRRVVDASLEEDEEEDEDGDVSEDDSLADDDDGEEEEEEDDDDDMGEDDEFGANYDADDGDESAEEGVSGSQWKESLTTRAAQAFLDRQKDRVNLMEVVYGKREEPPKGAGADASDDDDDDDPEAFFKLRKRKDADESGFPLNGLDSSRFKMDETEMQDWDGDDDECALEALRNRFVTGDWGLGAGADGAKEGDGEDDASVYGDFEDLETGEVHVADEEEQERREDAEMARIHSKLALKERFDEEYDAHGQKAKKAKKGQGERPEDDEDEQAAELARKLKEDQLKRNQMEFGAEGEAVRLKHEGFRQGLYVRITIKAVSAEFSRNFRPTVPVVLGGLLPHEMIMGLVRCRVKRHRWHRRVGDRKSLKALLPACPWH